MARTIEKAEKLLLPVIPLRGIVAFPSMPVNFELQREISIKALELSLERDMYIFLAAQKDISVESPSPDDLYKTGCVAKIKHSLRSSEDTVRVIAEGVCRGSAASYCETNGCFCAEVISKRVVSDPSYSDLKTEALMREAISALENMLSLVPQPSNDLLIGARSIHSPGALADFIAASAFVRYQDKQQILECSDPHRRLELICVLIEDELKLIRTESNIHKKVKEQIDENQREYYLREQLKVIQDELGMEADEECTELSERIAAAKLPENVEKKLRKELARLSRTQFGSPEATVSRGYIETCLDIPWNKKSDDIVDTVFAEKILNSDHDGLEKVKERILEYLAVKQMNPELGGQTICFVGPPGVGKTSLGRSIARAMNREYARVSLGGVRDESDIRGHRKTYIGSMPGRIITALTEAGTMNPVIQLDEIDKLCRDAHGDPASALLEVLDPEQNREFRDHFIELPVDLSQCIFLASANTLDSVPSPLLDRMEIIELHTYTPSEKAAIAKNHLLPKQMKRHGLSKRALKLSDEVISELISGYTRESGVRNLEREIAAVCRKSVKFMLDNDRQSVTVTPERLRAFLGPRKFNDDELYSENPIGVVNGLAYTEVGGDLLKIEVSVMEGTGKLELTGTLGDVMKESAHIAYSYVRANANALGVPADFYKNRDIHIHVPEGAVPKDGPSAGVTLTTALASALSETPVRCDTAMTGEVTLTGRVLPIGGLREKTTAAYTQGIKQVIIPEQNLPELESIDPVVRAGLTFIPCRRLSEVLDTALVRDSAENCEADKAPRTAIPHKGHTGWIRAESDR